MFELIHVDGNDTYILRKPVTILVPNAILSRLASIYPKTKETGGFLYASANAALQTLTIVDVAEVPNLSTVDTSYAPNSALYQAAIQRATSQGLLPLRFHSHPVQTTNKLYNLQSLNFFQKTSDTDRHTSYLPVLVNGQSYVLPDCLLSPDDRDGNTIRFSIYNGYVAPTSFRALLPNEQVFLYLTGIVFLVIGALFGWKRAASYLLVAGLVSIIIFIKEKRPTYQQGANGLLISL